MRATVRPVRFGHEVGPCLSDGERLTVIGCFDGQDSHALLEFWDQRSLLALRDEIDRAIASRRAMDEAATAMVAKGGGR